MPRTSFWPALEACESFSFCPRFLFSPARPRISAVWASHLRGSVGLGNWRGSRLRTVYRGIEIGTEVGKYRGSFPRFARRAWFADVGQSPVADGRHWSPGLGRLFNPSIEIGTEVGKYRGSFPRFARRAWFADVGQSPVADGRHWSPGLGRLFNPSI